MVASAKILGPTRKLGCRAPVVIRRIGLRFIFREQYPRATSGATPPKKTIWGVRLGQPWVSADGTKETARARTLFHGSNQSYIAPPRRG